MERVPLLQFLTCCYQGSLGVGEEGVLLIRKTKGGKRRICSGVISTTSQMHTFIPWSLRFDGAWGGLSLVAPVTKNVKTKALLNKKLPFFKVQPENVQPGYIYRKRY